MADEFVESHLLLRDRWVAHRALFRPRHTEESCEAHKEIVRLIHGPQARQGIEGFRGIGKSTLTEEACVIKKCYREFKNLVLLGASYTRAVDRLSAIKREFEINPMIPELFGDQRSGAPTWQEGKIVFPDDTCIQAVGRGQSMAGIKHFDWRPDAALVDDLEDPEEVLTDPEREAAWDWFLETFLPALADPVSSWVRVLGTRRGKGSLMERIEDELGWPVAKFPIEHQAKDGERTATWEAKFPLDKVDQIRRLYRGKMEIYEQEYMCRATSVRHQDFRRDMIKVTPRTSSWEARYGFIDPASSINRGSATTGWAVWSWVRNRLLVWGGGADRLLPDAVVGLAYRIVAEHNPVWLGIERDALNQFLMQPLRQEQVKRGLGVVPIKPVAAISGTKGGGKLAFIRGLQPFFAAGEVEFATDCPELVAQLVSFPYGPIDAPNALAYAQLLRPGLLVYDDFSDENIVHDLEPVPGRPLHLAANADQGIVTAMLVQQADGHLRIFADWVCEGTPAELAATIGREAQMLCDQGIWQERLIYSDDELLKMPLRQEFYTRLPLNWIVPGRHRNNWSNVGLMQAIRAIPQGCSAADGGDEKGRPALARMLQEHHRNRPAVLVSPNARWTLRAFTGGYSRAVNAHGITSAQPEPGAYRVLMEGLESFCAMARGLDREEDDPQPIAYTPDGTAYRSALPQRRPH